jgi:hypothetical protein
VSVAGKNAREQLSEQDQDDPLTQSYNELSDDELGLMRLYTFSYYEEFNKYLRGREIKGMDDEEKEFIENATRQMTESLNKLPNSEGGSFYRGLSGNPDTSQTIQSYAALEPGDVISDKGFSSFTSDKEIAGDFMTYGGNKQNILLINKSGKLKNISPVSGSPSEAEHLALPGTEFKVKSNKTVQDSQFGSVRVIEIEDVE